MKAKKFGFDKGEKSGFNKGEKSGSKSEKIKIAKALLNKTIDINFIMEVTELTKEEIEKIK